MTERWKQIVGLPDGYEVSNLGRVRSWRGSNGTVRSTPRLRKLVPNKRGGYMTVVFSTPEGHVCRFVHLMVLEAFVGPKPDAAMEGRHLNGDVSNNRVDNLEWGTRARNQADKIDHGTSQHGTRNHQAKLDEDDVRAIRRRSKAGERGVDLAAEYGVQPSVITRINKRTRWGHVQ